MEKDKAFIDPFEAALKQEEELAAGEEKSNGYDSDHAAKNENKENNVDNAKVEKEEKEKDNTEDDRSAKMQAILSQFTEEQMNRYEAFRRSAFGRSKMQKIIKAAAGTEEIPSPITIVVSGLAKMFVGELVETGRTVMTERNHTGPIRPVHIREAYSRLKREGKLPRKSVPRRFF